MSTSVPAQPRVLVATSHIYPHVGGASTHIDALIRQLSAIDRFAGVRQCGGVWFWSMQRLAMRLLAGGREGYRIAIARRLIANLTNGLYDALRRDSSIGLIHAHDHRACLAARAAVDRLGAGAGGREVAVVQTVHGPWLREMQQIGQSQPGTRSERFIREREAASFTAADRIITVDSGQKQIALEYGAAEAKIDVIFNAVDLEEIDRCAVQPATIAAVSPYFIVPRRLVPKTGVRYAVEAMAKVPADVRPRLLIAGDGPQFAELEALAAQLGVAASVQMLGSVPREKLLPLMARAAGIIVPSVPASGVVEATSLSAIEAMALRVPIIASAIGGLAEIIEHGKTGLLVPPADSAALADAIREALRPEVAARLGPPAREAVERTLSTQPWFAAIQQVYTKAVGVAVDFGTAHHSRSGERL